MPTTPDPDALHRLKARIAALRAKTTDNGCTEAEALAAAAKVAELLDRHDLALTDLDLGATRCEQRRFASPHKKRIPLDDVIGAVAAFCDCRVWREKTKGAEPTFVFFGLPADAEAAQALTELIDTAVRTELGRYKTTADYQRFRHQDRHLANASFAIGMVASIAQKLTAMKAARAQPTTGAGTSLIALKTSAVDAELQALGLTLHTLHRPARMVAPQAYDAGGIAGGALGIGPAIREGGRLSPLSPKWV